MQVKIFEQVFLDAGADAVTEEDAVGRHHGGPAGFGLAPEFAHDELEEEEGRFGGLHIIGKIAQDAPIFFAAEGGIGEDDIHPVLVADFFEGDGDGVAVVDSVYLTTFSFLPSASNS
jgi:hypothetical protein